jgi:hypothetical protein
MQNEESEKENDTTQPKKGTGRRKGKTRARQVHKKAATLAPDQQDEEDIELLSEGRLTRQDSATETQNMQDRTPVISKKSQPPTAKEKGKTVVSKPLDLDDSSDSDAPFSTRESGSSDESEEEDEEDEEDGEEEPKSGKGKKVSVATNHRVSHRSLEPAQLSPLILHHTHCIRIRTSTYHLLAASTYSSCTNAHSNWIHTCPSTCTSSRHLPYTHRKPQHPRRKAAAGLEFYYHQGILSIRSGFDVLTGVISATERIKT